MILFEIKRLKKCILIGIALLVSCGISSAKDGERRAYKLLVTFQKAADANINHIAGQTEWKELEIGNLIKKMDQTKTICGYHMWGHLLIPIDDRAIIEKRQHFLKYLVDNPSFLEKLTHLLTECAKNESRLLEYWQAEDVLGDKSARALYYSIPYLKNYLNKDRTALDLSLVSESMRYAYKIALHLGANGLYHEFLGYVTDENHNKIDWTGAIKNGFMQPLQMNNPFVTDTLKDHLDRKNKTLDDMSYHDTLAIGMRDGSFGDYTKVTGSWFQNTLKTKSAACFIPAVALSLVRTGYLYDYDWYTTLDSMWYNLKSMHTVMQALHKRTVEIATYIRTLQKIKKLIAQTSDAVVQDFIKACFFDRTEEPSNDFKKLLTLLKQSTFKSSGGYVYSRGNVLIANTLLRKEKKYLLPDMYDVAVLDVYASIARYIHSCKDAGRPINFVDFVADNQPQEIRIQDGWLPIIPGDTTVYNSLQLGGSDPRAIILTGPNGCGKSTVLKVLGINTWTALSFGFAFANDMHISILSGLRTALRPEESLAQGLSTFMAEAKVMNELKEFILSCTQDRKGLAIIGEPYRGTVEAETARKIVQFGRECAQNPYCIMGIETHVFEPTKLAVEFPSIYTNGQMRIAESTPGQFERTFILDKGPAEWWFFDAPRRARFVDWVEMLKPPKTDAPDKSVPKSR